MARYALSGPLTAVAATYKTMWSLTSLTGATTLRRAWIYDVTFGADGTIADQSLTYKLDRQTTAATGTAAAAAPLDGGDAVALITETINYSAEPTVTADTQLIEIPVNMRASYRWVAAPGGELVVPAVTANGIGGRVKSAAYVSTALSNVHFWE